MASGGSDGLIKIWNVDTGKKLQTLNAHSWNVYSVSYSPNGKLLASGGQDETLKIWNLGTVPKLAQSKKIDKSIVSVVFSPGGNHLISESEDGTIFVLTEILKDLTKISRDKYRVRKLASIKNDDGEVIQLLTKDMVIEWNGEKVIKPTEGDIQVDDLELLTKNKKDVVLFIRSDVRVFENREKIKEVGIIKKGEVIEEFYYSSNLDMYYLEESNIKGWLDIDTTDIQVQNKNDQNLDIETEKKLEKIVNQETEKKIAKEMKKETNKKKEKWEFDELNAFVISHASEKYEFSHFFATKDSSQVLSYRMSLQDNQTLGAYIGYGITPFANVKIGVNSNTQPVLGLDLNIPIIPFVNVGFKLSADYIFDTNEVQSRYAIGYMVLFFVE